jgi:hypothetical protein
MADCHFDKKDEGKRIYKNKENEVKLVGKSILTGR